MDNRETILNYNFDPRSIQDKRFDTLYQTRRRDSIFAFVFRENRVYYALRDHLGITPLYYTKHQDQYFFSTSLAKLPHKNTLDTSGLKAYLGFGTTKILPLFEGVKIVPPGAVLKIDAEGLESIVYRYQIRPTKIALTTNLNTLVDNYEELFTNALKQQLGLKSVASLYLSGGIDSALIALYLNKLGISLRTFSSVTRRGDQENLLIEKNVKITKPEESYIDFLTDSYQSLSENIPPLYQQPNGVSTIFAVTSLWRNTPLNSQPIIFVGQNCDVITNAMDNRLVGMFGNFIPKTVRKLINWKTSGAIKKYAQSLTEQLVNFTPIDLELITNGQPLTNFQLVALAGIYLGRTPADSECLIQPAINRKIAVGNPYYDLDLIEFLLGLRLRHKMSFLKSGIRNPVSADKLIVRLLAKKTIYPER